MVSYRHSSTGIHRATKKSASGALCEVSAIERTLIQTTSTTYPTMLITKTYHDVPSKLDPNGRPIRIFVIAPSVPSYPNAKFPGVVCFRSGLTRLHSAIRDLTSAIQ